MEKNNKEEIVSKNSSKQNNKLMTNNDLSTRNEDVHLRYNQIFNSFNFLLNDYKNANSDLKKELISNKELTEKIDEIDEKFSIVLDSQEKIIKGYETENSDLKNKINTAKELSTRNDEIYLRYNYILDSFCDLVEDYKKNNEKLEDELISNKQILNKVNEIESKYKDILASQEKLIKDYKNENMKLKKDIKLVNKKLSSNDKILSSHYNLLNLILLEYDFKPKGLLKQLRLLTQEMMIFLMKICEKYNLSFWLDYGTLLGAVRHQGFIPWDDDIDLAMMRKDFDKFLNIFNDELSRLNLSNVVKLTIDQTPSKNLIMSFIKISFDYIKLIDIFPYDFINTQELSEDLYLSERNKFYISLIKGKPKKDVVNQCFKNLNLLYEDGDYILPGVEGVIGSYYNYPLDIREKNIIFPLQMIEFENIKFPCPNNYDAYLKGIYGNYKNTPKLIRDHNLLNKLRMKENIENDISHAIEVMKTANQNF